MDTARPSASELSEVLSSLKESEHYQAQQGTVATAANKEFLETTETTPIADPSPEEETATEKDTSHDLKDCQEIG